ncbi:uncharacterized protein [Argopecten irradians]|uniref:uncharacterized protein n=1 Tax=Argopecten irradians TaxID=31199 RepID=UPI003716C6A2
MLDAYNARSDSCIWPDVARYEIMVTSIQPGTNTIGSVRTYMCNGYTAVNYSITCQSNAQWTAPNFMCVSTGQYSTEWPFGSFSLLQPLAGCPSGFESGSRMWHTEQTSTNEMSPGSNLKGFATGANVEWHFCTRVVFLPSLSSSKNNWPRGNYCVMRFGGICPEGFDEGNIFWDEEDSDVTDRQMNGTMPDGTFDVNSRIHFCCRNDDDPRNPIMLPRTKPFILFRYTLDECQEVFNMTFTKENTQFMDETFNNGDVAFGETPRKDGPPNWRIYYCYYE